MDQRRRRLVQFSIAVVVFHVVTTALCVVMRWPAQFGGAGDPGNVAGEMWWRGTAIGAPVMLTLVLALATLAASRTGRAGDVGAVVIGIVSLLIIVGGSGEAFGAPSPDVPTPVLILSGVVNVILSLVTLYLVYQSMRKPSSLDAL